MKRLPNLYIRITGCLITLLGVIWVASQQLSGETDASNITQSVIQEELSVNSPQDNETLVPETSEKTEDLGQENLSLNNPPVPNSAGNDLIVQAKISLRNHQPIRAKLTQIIRIGTVPIRAEGAYIEGGSQQLRMQLSIKTPHTTGELLQVCDGQILWTEFARKSAELAPEGDPKITRRDIGEILQVARSSDNVQAARHISELAIGGLTALFSAFENTMDFSEPQEIQKNGVSMLVIEGSWAESFLTKHHQTDLARLPRHVPDKVRLYLDMSTLFPRRILFLKQQKDEEELQLITYNFDNIALNTTVNPQEFEYVLTDQSYDDVTNAYLRRLHEAE